MKRIIALILAALCLVTMFGCVRKSETGTEAETNEDGTVKELKSKNVFNILVMGHDRQASLTDVMMLVNFDTEEGKMTIMQLPRDTYIEVEDYSYHKINGMYNHFVLAAKEDKSEKAALEGCKRTAKYLSESLGIKIHYSAVMDLDGFGSIVDAIGGVYMYVPYSMKYNDPAQKLYIDLPEGYNTLDGNEAEQFVRYRSGFVNADLGRGDAQKMFMTAFIESVKKNIGVDNIADIAYSILANVETDMTVRRVIDLGKSVLNVELSDITMLTIPGEVASSYYVINKEALHSILDENYNVYSDPVKIENVDKNEVFCDDKNSAMVAVYEKSADEIDFEKHNAQDVSDEDIYIPMK